MAESVQLGAAHVVFTGDFGQLLKDIDQAVKTARQAAKQIEDAFKGVEVGAKRVGLTVTMEFVRAATSSVRAWNAASQSIRAALRKITAELVFLQLDVSHLGNMFKRMAAVGTAAMGGMTAAAISFEDAFANVRKTVDASEAEFRQLERNLREMSTRTRTGANDLAVIMGIAGQLGVRGVDNLTKFTQTVDYLTVATNLAREEGASAIARLMNIMQEPLSNVDRLGAAVTELGNNFATTEAEIISMAQRIAGAGKTVGLTTADVLGLATALSAVGIRAEMGGSAISRVLVNMSQAVEQNNEHLTVFARTAGMSARQFADTFRRDPIRALQAFIEGLRRLDAEGRNVFQTLEDVGASEIRVRDTLLRLFQASDLLADAVARSNRAWEENTALMEEVEKRFGTTASQLRMAWNNIVELARLVGDVYNPAVRQAAQFTRNLVDAFRSMTPEQQRAIAEFGALATAVLGGIAAFLLGVKAIATFGTGLVLLTRAVAFFLSPWTMLTMAVIAGAVAIASKWDEIKQAIEQTDLAQTLRNMWQELQQVWQSEELTLPEKVLKSVEIIVENIDPLINSIVNLWLDAAIPLARRGAELLGLDPDTAWLPNFLEKLQGIWQNSDLTLREKVVQSVTLTAKEILGLAESIADLFVNMALDLARDVAVMLGLDEENSKLVKLIDDIKAWWNSEDITLPEKALGVVAVYGTIQWLLRPLLSFISAAALAGGLLPFGTGWLARLGVVTVTAALKWVLVTAGWSLFFMDEETRNQLREQVRASFQEFREDIQRIWMREFGPEWEQALRRASEEGRLFDPLTVIVDNVTETVQAFRRSLAPVTAIVRDWVAGIFGDVSLSEAFRRGMGKGEIDPRSAALWQSLIDLGTAIGELLVEAIAAAFDVAELIGLIFMGPLAKIGGALAEVGAYWAGAISKGFIEEWQKLEEWFRNSWLGKTLAKLGIIEAPGATFTETDYLRMSPEERGAFVREFGESLGPTELRPTPTTWERFRRWLGWGEAPTAPEPLTPTAPTVKELIEQASTNSRLSKELLLVLAQQESSLRALVGSGGPFQLRRLALEDVRRSGFYGPFDTPEGLVQAGVRYADIMLKYFEHYRPQIEEQMARLGIDAAQAFSIAWVTGVEGFLGLKSLEEVITVVDGKAQTAAERLEQMARAMEALGISEVRLPGFRDGVILPGFGGGDRIPALLEPGEAVVPARVVRGGLSDIVAWFRAMGVTKMQGGGLVGTSSLSAMLAASPREAIAMAERMQEEAARELSSFADRMLEGIKEVADMMHGFIFGAAQLIVNVLKALFPDHAEAIQESFDDFKAWWDRTFRQERRVTEEPRRDFDLERPPMFMSPIPVERSWWEELLENAKLLVEVTTEGFNKMRAGIDGLRVLFPGGGFAQALEQFSLNIYHFGRVVDLFDTGWDNMVNGFDEILNGFRRFFGNLGPVGGAAAGYLMGGGGGIGGILGAVGGLIGGPVGLGLTLIGGLFGGLFGGSGETREPRTFTPPDPLRGGLQQAIEEKRRLEAEVKRLEERVKQEERHVRRMDNFWDRMFGGYDRAVKALKRWRQELENAKRAFEEFSIAAYLGFDAQSLVRTIESAFDMADPTRLGASLEKVIYDALVRAWATSAEMISLQKEFSSQLEQVMIQFAETGQIQATALDPLRTVIAAIQERGEAFGELLKELGITTEDVNREMAGLSRNIPRIFKINLERFRVADVTDLPSLASEGYITRSGLAMVHAGEIVARAERFGGDINVTVHIHGDGWDSDRLRATIRREVSNAVRDSLSARYGIAGVGV